MVPKCNRLQLESILMDDKKVATLEQNSKNDYLTAILNYIDDLENTFVSMEGQVRIL